MELALAFFQLYLRLQLPQVQLRGGAGRRRFLGLLLDVGNITLDRFAGFIFSGAAAGGTSVSSTPSWVSCWIRRVVFPSSLATAVVLAHSGTVFRAAGAFAALLAAPVLAFPAPFFSATGCTSFCAAGPVRPALPDFAFSAWAISHFLHPLSA